MQRADVCLFVDVEMFLLLNQTWSPFILDSDNIQELVVTGRMGLLSFSTVKQASVAQGGVVCCMVSLESPSLILIQCDIGTHFRVSSRTILTRLLSSTLNHASSIVSSDASIQGNFG